MNVEQLGVIGDEKLHTVGTHVTIDAQSARIVVEFLHETKRTRLGETKQIPLAHDHYIRTVHLNVNRRLADIVRIVGQNSFLIRTVAQMIDIMIAIATVVIVVIIITTAASSRCRRRLIVGTAALCCVVGELGRECQRLILVGLDVPRGAHCDKTVGARHVLERSGQKTLGQEAGHRVTLVLEYRQHAVHRLHTQVLVAIVAAIAERALAHVVARACQIMLVDQLETVLITVLDVAAFEYFKVVEKLDLNTERKVNFLYSLI